MGGGGGASGAEGNSSTTLDGKRKSEMTAEERASYFRERNRVHARNTRARKKQYMEELKERVVKMHAQRVSVKGFVSTNALVSYCWACWACAVGGSDLPKDVPIGPTYCRRMFPPVQPRL